MNNPYDIIVIGAGPAGYSAAIRAAQMNATVLLIEKDALGGACLNWGCIPTKFLWESVALEKKIKRAGDYGIEAEIRSHSFSSMQQKKTRLIELLRKSLRSRIESYSISVVEGTGRFAAKDTVAVQFKDGHEEHFKGKKYIIAAGSKPNNLPQLSVDHEKVIDSTDLLNSARVPKSLLVIGGGAIGVEMAAIFSALGSEVLLIEKEPQILPGEDGDLARDVQTSLERGGVKVITGSGAFAEYLPQYEKVLLVTGRRAHCDGLALEKGEIKYSAKGIVLNEFLQTSNENVYAAGDVAGNYALAYTAQAEGIITAENALGARNKPDYSAIPRVIFSIPPCASVGNNKSDTGIENLAVGKFSLASNSRASIESERVGWFKITSQKNSGKIMGGALIAPHAEDLISIVSIAVRHGLTVNDLHRELFFHPSISESIHEAAEDCFARSTELPRK